MIRSAAVHEKRLVPLNGAPERAGGRYVLYWMQVQQRAEMNPALDFAIERANALKLPVLVYHGLRSDYPHASDRLHAFVLEGARELPARFEAMGIRYVFYLERSAEKARRRKVLLELLEDAALVVTDLFPTFVVPAHNAALARAARVAAVAVDGNGVVPLREMTKEEWAARTIRPKIHRLMPEHFRAPERVVPSRDAASLRLPVEKDAFLDVARADVDELLAALPIDHSVPRSPFFRGGRAAAREWLDRFLRLRLRSYADGRNEPGEAWTSELSPYLHFGQISILEAALAVRAAAAKAGPANADAFLEEAIVRRELAYNMALFNPRHATLDALPEWAAATLRAHRRDARPFVYSAREFESAATHDPIWNATQREMLVTGKIHGYVRMYWGKKILEWSESPEAAHRTMVFLNDRYGLDGRNPNTYTNILWCFGKHDRPWGERPVYGTVRSMTDGGLRRKCDIDAYVARIAALGPAPLGSVRVK